MVHTKADLFLTPTPKSVDGLVDTRHPYAFIVSAGLTELLESVGARDKISPPLLASLVRPLRAGLGSADESIVRVSVKALRTLALTVDVGILDILSRILPPIAAKLHNGNAEIHNDILETLRSIECVVVEAPCHGKSEETRREYTGRVLRIIKQKVPTYCSVFF